MVSTQSYRSKQLFSSKIRVSSWGGERVVVKISVLCCHLVIYEKNFLFVASTGLVLASFGLVTNFMQYSLNSTIHGIEILCRTAPNHWKL